MDTQSNALHQLKSIAWNRTQIIPDYDQNVWRRDRFGHAIKWSDYGNRNSDYGWELDHVIPSSKGGPDHHENREALHWRNNVAKGDKFVA